jgi:hypothetical protein
VRAETGSFDWRDPAAYSPLLGADRPLIAWEWLRRDPVYRSAAARVLSERPRTAGHAAAGDFGLVDFEDPDLGVPDARPMWSADAYPYVLRAGRGTSGEDADCFDVRAAAALSRLLIDDAGDHLLLSDGLRYIRLDADRGLFRASAPLRYELEGLAAAEAPLLTLRRFLAFSRHKRFSHSLHLHEPRARRWILMLRAWDGRGAGANQRDIARELLSRSAHEPDWRTREPSIRSQAQRLVRSARAMASGGFRALLG